LRIDGMAEIRMIVGLGNPGAEYAGTRHNAGFEVVDLLAEVLGTDVKKSKFGARFGECEFAGGKVILLKPQLYMNRSGEPVATAAGFYRLGAGDVIVVLDDMALEPGRIRIRAKGSAGGHKGLADVLARFGTDEVVRLRIGIGRSDEPDSARKGSWGADYVLSRPTPEQRTLIDAAIDRAKDAVLCWAEYGVDEAMTRFNSAAGEDTRE